MLVLTRRTSEVIVINDDIIITILGNHKGVVRVGIDAPKNVSVHRAEIYNRIQDEKLRKTAEGDKS